MNVVFSEQFIIRMPQITTFYQTEAKLGKTDQIPGESKKQYTRLMSHKK